jgi:MscS family membrane protein
MMWCLRMTLSIVMLMSFMALAPRAQAQDPNSCATPQDAVYGLLYWLQPERYDPQRAAACLDRSQLKDPATQGPQLAVNFKKVIDARGLYVKLEAIPSEADYKDSAGKHRYDFLARDLPMIVYAREGDEWRLTAQSLAEVPALYGATFNEGLERLVTALPPVFTQKVFGVAWWQLLGLVLLLVVAWLFRVLAIGVLRVLIRQFMKRFSWLEHLYGHVKGPVGGLALGATLIYVQPELQLPVVMSATLMSIGRLSAALSLLGLAFVLIDAFVDGMARRAEGTESRMDDQLMPLLRKTLKVVVGVVGMLWILESFDVDVTSLIATASVASLGVALAAKDTVANVFGSVMVFIDKPFQIGDYVTVGGVSGTVEEVGFRSSRLRTPTGSIITIPNARMTDSQVENLGERPNRRYDTAVGLTYDTPPDRVQAFCAGVVEIIEAHPLTLKDKNIVRFVSFGASSLDIQVRCWFDTTSLDEEAVAKHQLNMEILRFAEALGVAFAFPSQSVYLEGTPEHPASTVGSIDEAPMEIARSFGSSGSRGMVSRWA